MWLSHQKTGYLQFSPYFHFAEPYPAGVVVAFADATVPDDELADAAEAVRAAEIEAVQEHDSGADASPLEVMKSLQLTPEDLEGMSIDEVRAVANMLDVPNRETITEKSELIREVLRRL